MHWGVIGEAIGGGVAVATFFLTVWTRLVTKPLSQIVESIERLKEEDDRLDRRISYLEGVHDTMALYSQTGKGIDNLVRVSQGRSARFGATEK